MDTFVRPEVSQMAKDLDKELAIHVVQSLALDALAPYLTLLEYDGDLSPEAVKDAASTGIMLIGNSNTHLRRKNSDHYQQVFSTTSEREGTP